MVGDRSAGEKKGKVSLAPRQAALAAARQGGGVGGAPSLFELGFFLFPLDRLLLGSPEAWQMNVEPF